MIFLVIKLIILFMLPVFYLWCVKPGKSIRDGLKDWIDESIDDI